MRINFISYSVNVYTFRTVYLVRRKKDAKPLVIKEQDLVSMNYLSSKVYDYTILIIIHIRIKCKIFRTFFFQIVLGEVRCLQRMRHPNIVFYYGAWIRDNRSYILMEYATRCTLKDLLAKQKMPLTEKVILYHI